MIALYFRLIGSRIRSQMQYKLSFILETIGFMLLTGVDFVVLVLLVQRFHSVHGWSIPEMALLYGLSGVCFSLGEMVMRGFDLPFTTMMRQGSFDIILIRPLNTFFQIMTAEFQLRRLGRTFQAGAVLVYALLTLQIHWTVANLLLLILTLLSGILVYAGIFVISATICFWTIQPPEIINVFTNGGQYMSSYPQSIYNRWIRTVFLFIVPVALTSYPLALVLLERSDPNGLPSWIAWLAPLVSCVFFAVTVRFWRYGVGKYQSTGN